MKLEDLLGEELYGQVKTKIDEVNAKETDKLKHVRYADLSEGEYVSKGKHQSIETELIDLKEQIKTANETIKTLKGANKDNEDLQATIKIHETTIATMKSDYDKKIKEMKINNAINSKLTDTKYSDLLITKFDKSKLTMADDGETVLGIDEQLKTIKETYKDLFTTSVNGKKPNNSGGSNPAIKNPWAQEHFNLTEQARILREDPELAKQLQNV